MSALSINDATVFIMKSKVIDKIKKEFNSIYQEMKNTASKKFKLHQILIANELRKYWKKAKLEELNCSDSDSDEGVQFDDNMSLNSENIDIEFEK